MDLFQLCPEMATAELQAFVQKVKRQTLGATPPELAGSSKRAQKSAWFEYWAVANNGSSLKAVELRFALADLLFRAHRDKDVDTQKTLVTFFLSDANLAGSEVISKRKFIDGDQPWTCLQNYLPDSDDTMPKPVVAVADEMRAKAERKAERKQRRQQEKEEMERTQKELQHLKEKQAAEATRADETALAAFAVPAVERVLWQSDQGSFESCNYHAFVAAACAQFQGIFGLDLPGENMLNSLLSRSWANQNGELLVDTGCVFARLIDHINHSQNRRSEPLRFFTESRKEVRFHVDHRYYTQIKQFCKSPFLGYGVLVAKPTDGSGAHAMRCVKPTSDGTGIVCQNSWDTPKSPTIPGELIGLHFNFEGGYILKFIDVEVREGAHLPWKRIEPNAFVTFDDSSAIPDAWKILSIDVTGFLRRHIIRFGSPVVSVHPGCFIAIADMLMVDPFRKRTFTELHNFVKADAKRFQLKVEHGVTYVRATYNRSPALEQVAASRTAVLAKAAEANKAAARAASVTEALKDAVAKAVAAATTAAEHNNPLAAAEAVAAVAVALADAAKKLPAEDARAAAIAVSSVAKFALEKVKPQRRFCPESTESGSSGENEDEDEGGESEEEIEDDED